MPFVTEQSNHLPTSVALVVGWAGVAGRAILRQVSSPGSEWSEVVAIGRRKGMLYTCLVVSIQWKPILVPIPASVGH